MCKGMEAGEQKYKDEGWSPKSPKEFGEFLWMSNRVLGWSDFSIKKLQRMKILGKVACE